MPAPTKHANVDQLIANADAPNGRRPPKGPAAKPSPTAAYQPATGQYVSDVIGAPEDAVSLQLGGEDLFFAEAWDVVDGIMAQPQTWSMRIGWGGVASQLLRKYPNRTQFRLFVAGQLQCTGYLDGRGASASSGATTITLKGTDALALLHRYHVKEVRSFKDARTFSDLVSQVLTIVGLDPKLLRSSNDANRKIKAGIPVTSGNLPHQTVAELIASADNPTKGIGVGAAPAVGVTHREVQAKLNETWWGFLRRYLDRAGLFLWGAADGTFVLSQPNGKQQPAYALTRGTGEPSDIGCNVVSFSFDDDASNRHSEAILYGRTGGKKFGRAKAKGGFIDREMLGWGYDQPIVFRDVDVQNPVEAVFFARRKLAEERRAGWHLEYTIAGHTLPSTLGPTGSRAVLTPDTVIRVTDLELGIEDNFYIESVRRQRSPQTTTTIRLMRLEDLVFGGIGSAEG